MENLNIFIALTAAAVALQAGILAAMYLSLRKATARMELVADEIRNHVGPAAETMQSLLLELRPKIETAVDNISDATIMVRAQMERMDATVGDVIDRTRLQVIRADELLTRALDRVEETTEMVHDTVVSPIRQLSGLLQGLTAGLEFLVGSKKRRRDGVSVPQDEMFI